MEDPQVIREIDALIDSYNWEGAQTQSKPVDVAHTLKLCLRDTPASRSLGAIPRLPPAYQFMLLQMALKLLDHPHLKDKTWCLGILEVSFHHHRADAWEKRGERLIQSAMPLFHRLLNHHRAEYRISAATLLSRLPLQANQVASWILERLQRERSPRVRDSIVRELDTLIQSRVLTPLIRHKILAYLEALSHVRQPALVLRLASIALSVLGHQTPPVFLDNAIACWPRIDHLHNQGDGRRFVTTVKSHHKEPDTILDQLIANTRTWIGMNSLLLLILNHRIYREQRWIMMTPHLRHLIERAIACHDIQLKTRSALYLNIKGLEASRQVLRQQIKHSQITATLTPPSDTMLPLFWDGTRIQARSQL